MAFAGFDRSFFAFLKTLKTHNTREWFAEHKTEYQRDVEGPAMAFVADLAPRLKRISPRVLADPRRVGGSMFRIYRDTRFSHDKTPYKTHVGIRFRHDGKDLESAPAFYLHLSPGECFGGGGLYHADPTALRAVRLRIHEAPREWKTASTAGLEADEESLKRVPAGFPADHPLAQDLKRKNYFVLEEYTQRDAGSATFIDRYLETCERTAPLMKFLSAALGQKW
jgi:uncharacterized protein (TIGR02453 family)